MVPLKIKPLIKSRALQPKKTRLPYFWFNLQSIFRVTEDSTGLVRLLFDAKHRNLLNVCDLSNFRMVRPFLTTPSKVCW